MDLQPSAAEPLAAALLGLRQVNHPDLSPLLFHFVDRNRPDGPGVPEEVQALGPVERMEAILTQGAISAFVTYSGGTPSVCMTETTWAGVSYLIESCNYEPWALMFDRQKVYAAGGGPVWYARPAEYQILKAAGLRSWAVELSDRSDWSHEREWRIPRQAERDGGAPSIPLSELGFCGVIVGDSSWDFRIFGHDPYLGDGSEATHWDYLPAPALAGVPRYWWNPAERIYVQM